jgi:hypothetical protein
MQAARAAANEVSIAHEQRQAELADASNRLAKSTHPPAARAIILRYPSGLNPSVLLSKWPLVVSDIPANRELVRVHVGVAFFYRVRELGRTPVWEAGSLGRGSTTTSDHGDVFHPYTCVVTVDGDIWSSASVLLDSSATAVAVPVGTPLHHRRSGSYHELTSGRVMEPAGRLGAPDVVSAVQVLTPQDAAERVAASRADDAR